MIDKQLTINQKRLEANIKALAEVGKFGETGVCRLALSPEYKAGIKLVEKWMIKAGLKTRIDHFGNLIGRLDGDNNQAPVLMIGSHIDSQPYGGQYDGSIGVLGGLEVVQTIKEQGITPTIPIEIISFCDEEGYRFHQGLFGSRGIIGRLDDNELESIDNKGVTRSKALTDFGINPDRLFESEYPIKSIDTYLEMHIEQGPVLESSNDSIGIVTGISGPLWLTVELSGLAGHAGSVPMNQRKDALLGAAEVIASLNGIVKQVQNAPTVGTIGNLSVYPNARAIIPEKVTFTIDLRDIDIHRRNHCELQLRTKIKDTAKRYGLRYNITEDTNITPVFCDKDVTEIMHKESKRMGLEYVPELMSGPFHDALIMAEVCKIGMIFVQSKDGISHHPAEFSAIEHISIGTELLYRTALQLMNE